MRPNEAEKEFLTLAYNRFYNIFEEAFQDSFWKRDDWYRLSKIKEAFAVYAELLQYEPIQWIIEYLKKARPPMEAEIASELFKFVRNVIIHVAFFDSWDAIWVNKNIINWAQEGKSIDKFLKKYEKHQQVKYRFWEADKKIMTYLTINFPNSYSKGDKIFLKDVLSEKEGVKFSFILMRQVMNTQVEIDEKEHLVINACVSNKR